MDFEDRYVREDECLRITGLSRSTRHRGMKNGTFPQTYAISPQARGWKLSELMLWMNSRSLSSLNASPLNEVRQFYNIAKDFAKTSNTNAHLF